MRVLRLRRGKCDADRVPDGLTKSAVLRAITSGRRVLLVGDDLRLASREVTVGLSNWDYTEILAGLEPGDRVVVSLDRAEVAPGAAVVVEAEEGAP